MLSRVIGPVRYEFLVGSLKGHTVPKDPWVHAEKISFRPTRDLEFGFERTVIWGGKGHEPVNLHTFLQSFFSFDSVISAVKHSPQDPGARFGAFDFSYRLPFPRNWLTLYTDMEAHDTVSPLFEAIAWHLPARPLSLPFSRHTEARYARRGRQHRFILIQAVSAAVISTMKWFRVQGYTNQGQLFGDWIGREDKGGQAWTTYHLSGNEWIQLGWRTQKAAKDFIPGGTTLDDVDFNVVKRIGRDFEINGTFNVRVV